MDTVSRRATPDAPGAGARVAVVIVNHNSGPLLGRCLASLAAQSRPPSRTIVVDNASTDGSAAGLPGSVECIRLPRNAGFAAANNVGIERSADCEWVALLNPDAFPEPGWLEALLDAAAGGPRYSFFASRQLCADDPARLDGVGDEYAVSGLAWRRGYRRLVSRPTTSRARCSRPALQLRSTAAVPSSTLAASTRASSATSRTWTSRSGCGFSGTGACTSLGRWSRTWDPR
jgi:hypothetical protein